LQYNPNTNDSSFIHTYPAPGNYFVTLTLQDTFGCRSVIPGIVNVPFGAIADAGPDITLCSNDDFQMGTPAIPGQTYQWTPPVNLSNAAIAQPTFSLPLGPITQDSFFYQVTVDDGTCVTFDYTEVLINPSLEISLTPSDPVICIGDSVTLRVTGNLQADFTYLWSTGDTTDSIRVAPDETQSYSVVAFSDGCSSDPVSTVVSVQTGPPATITGVLEACPNGTVTLRAAGGFNYVWSAGGFIGESITLGGLQNDTTVFVIPFDDQGCPGTPDTATVTLLPEPVPNFTADLVCEGSSTNFSDASSIPGGSIAEWSWDFGDGNTSSGPNPQNIFDTPGGYNVTLEVSSDRGCSVSVTQPIVVNASPTADFTVDEVCEGVVSDFTNTSTIEPGFDITGLSWDFGDDAGTGVGNEPSYVYPEYGIYNVTLTAVTGQGCSDSFTRTTFIHPNPVPGFTFDQVCAGRNVLFRSTSQAPGDRDFVQDFSWTFGTTPDPNNPNDFSTLANPERFYDSSGVYLVSLEVTSNNGCTSDTSIEMTVYQIPAADFTYDQTCENERTQFSSMSMTDPATPIAQYFWDLGDSSTTRTGQNVGFRYGPGNYGTYAVSLVVETNVGCTDTMVKEVVINPAPEPSFTTSPVCLLDSSVFVGDSRIALGSIEERFWDFGDGRTTFGRDPLHEYLTDGQYTVVLTLTSDSGCVTSTNRRAVVHPKPELLQIREDSVCFGKPAAVFAVSTPGVEVYWYYNENDSLPFHIGNSLLTDPLPISTTYYLEPVSPQGCINDRTALIATVYDGGDQELVPSDRVVEMPGAIVEFSIGSTVPLEGYNWNFGDRSENVEVANPVHEYQFPGKYPVTVTTVDINGCENTLTDLIEVKYLVDIFTPTAFTPNGDDRNDVYKIGYVNVRDFNIQIFNRWGQMVFESNNPDFEWNGLNQRNQRPVLEGVYVAVIRATDLDGNDLEDSRTITLIR
ncbi:MAG: PKD domain-containing protein, partial [Bacteroidota bacterium]